MKSVLGLAVAVLMFGCAHTTASKDDAPSAESLRVRGDVTTPQLIQSVEPIYPLEAIEAGIQGTVVMDVVIDKNGDVTDVQMLKPLPCGLDEASVNAVRRWKFRPATLYGKPVVVTFNITFNFML